MVTFNNAVGVQNQAGQQVINGDVNFYPDAPRSSGRQILKSEEQLDDTILESLAFPEMSYRRMNVQSPYKHTCEWIFSHKEYQAWESSSSGLLWIKGKPGAGKSTLMSRLYSHFRQIQHKDSAVLLEFFFNARGTDLQRTELGMFRSLLNQIFYQNHDIREVVRQPCRERYGTLGSKSSDWQWQLFELERLLLSAVLAAHSRRKTLIFIDALDEAGEQVARGIAHFFHELNDEVSRRVSLSETWEVKICISCRHYPIASFFQTSQICVEDHNSNDIELYVKDRLGMDKLRGTDDARRCNEWQELAERVLSMARGIFQWVRLVVQLIELRRSRGQSPKKIRQWLSHVPKDLSQVYEHILTQVVDPDDRSGCLLLFKWTCLPKRPLSLTELQQVLVFSDTTNTLEEQDFADSNEDMISQIQAWSGGLIEVIDPQDDDDDDTTIIQVIHQSVNDYILNEGFKILATLYKPVQKLSPGMENSGAGITNWVKLYHGHLYRCCLNYLRMFSRQEKAFFIAAQSRHDVMTYSKLVLGRITRYSFVKYAAVESLYHAHNTGTSREWSLQEEVEAVTEATFGWAEVSDVLECSIIADMSPLHVATVLGFEDLVSYMLEHNLTLDTDHTDCLGRSALEVAIEYDDLALTKTLASVRNDSSKRALCLAAEHDRVEIFNYFLHKKVNDDDYKEQLSEALCAAASSGARIIAETCIEAGADVNFHSDGRGSALRLASGTGRLEMMEMLIKAGADPNQQGYTKDSILKTAVMSPDKTGEAVRLLLDAGAQANPQGQSLDNVLSTACYFNTIKVARILIEAGASVHGPEIDEILEPGERYQTTPRFVPPEIIQMLQEARTSTKQGTGG